MIKSLSYLRENAVREIFRPSKWLGLTNEVPPLKVQTVKLKTFNEKKSTRSQSANFNENLTIFGLKSKELASLDFSKPSKFFANSI